MTVARFIRFKKFVLLAGDITLLYVSLFLTLKLRYWDSLNFPLWKDHLLPFSIVFIVWIVIFFINNLYAVQRAKNDFKFYGYLVQNLVINALIGFTFFYLAPPTLTSLRPLRVLIILLGIYALLFLLWRRLFYSLTINQRLVNNVMFIGVNREAIELAEEIKNNPAYGYSLAYIVNPDRVPLPESLQAIPHGNDLAGIVTTITNSKIQTIVTVPSPQHSSEVSRYLFNTLNMGLAYASLSDFYEELTGKVPVASLEKEWFLQNLPEGSKKFYEIFKRASDICLALSFGMAALALVPFIASAIKLNSPGPLLFKQSRTGKGGKLFMAMKFRTMVVGAETNGPQWAAKNDPRVTRVGRVLRKTRLDEIPQFINILKGDMSFVGPRPERPEFVSLLAKEIPFYNQRLIVKPGLSGWAQINYKYGESIEDALTKLQYDLYYIKNRSFTLDLSIILKTINTVFNASLGQ